MRFFFFFGLQHVALTSIHLSGILAIYFVLIFGVVCGSQMKQDAKGVDTKGIAEGKQIQFGQQDFEACMRKLDRAGVNTGYPYQRPELLSHQ